MELSAALPGACHAGPQPKEVRHALRTSPHRHSHRLRRLVHCRSHSCLCPARPGRRNNHQDTRRHRCSRDTGVADHGHGGSRGSHGSCHRGPGLLTRATEVGAVPDFGAVTGVGTEVARLTHAQWWGPSGPHHLCPGHGFVVTEPWPLLPDRHRVSSPAGSSQPRRAARSACAAVSASRE